MSHKRAHVVIPEDLLREIDLLVGQRGRSAFLVEVLRQEVNRRRLLKMLREPGRILKGDYPEFEHGAEEFVRRLRETDDRLDKERLGEWLSDAKK